MTAPEADMEGPARAEVGMCFDRTFPPGFVVEVAEALERSEVDQLWIIEDCFFTGGVTLASAALSRTERLTVGIGILPAVARTAAITAMELATLSGLAPGRLLAGIGHGVQGWMQQMGVRPESPLTALDEVIVSVRRLLAGERVTFVGDYVELHDVELDQPPPRVPPLLAGVRGPRSLALAGRVADGVVLAEPAGPDYVRLALDQAGRSASDWHVAVYAPCCVLDDARTAREVMAPWLGGLLEHEPSAGLTALPFFDEMAGLHRRDGAAGLAGMPAEWWRAIGPIGDLDDANTHLSELDRLGVRSVGLFPPPDVDGAREMLPLVAELARGRRRPPAG